MATESMIPPLDDLVEKHMHKDVASLKTGQTVFEALAAIRNSPPCSSNIIYFYVSLFFKLKIIYLGCTVY